MWNSVAELKIGRHQGGAVKGCFLAELSRHPRLSANDFFLQYLTLRNQQFDDLRVNYWKAPGSGRPADKLHKGCK